MARDFRIHGEVLIAAKFGAHIPPQSSLTFIDPIATSQGSNLMELGLAEKETVVIDPTYYHRDINVDDFGPFVPAEVLAMIAWVDITATLVHYDPDVLDICMGESLGGLFTPLQPAISGHTQAPASLGFGPNGDIAGAAGTLVPAGTPLGGGTAPLASGNHYISLNLLSPVLKFPWRFPTCHLEGRPVKIPMGVRKDALEVKFRAVPYVFPPAFANGQFVASGQLVGTTEISCSGAVLWNHVIDT